MICRVLIKVLPELILLSRILISRVLIQLELTLSEDLSGIIFVLNARFSFMFLSLPSFH